eukprot:4008343-Pyramimonas_sp.AAC.1
MVEVVTMAREQPTQVQEGLQQIYQSVVHVMKSLGFLEDLAENFDDMQQRINDVGDSLRNVE